MTREELEHKFLSGDLNIEGVEKLRKELGEDAFKVLVQEKYLIDLSGLKANESNVQLKSKGEHLFTEKSNKVYKLKWIRYAAAIAMILVVAGVGYRINDYYQKQKFIVDNSVILKLQDGSEKVISQQSPGADLSDISAEINSEKTLLSYAGNEDVNSDQVVYNELVVPEGKRFKVRLSDGTLVYLNSKSHLKYPVWFKGMSTREVTLQGEGYFQVAKNPDKPFVVNTTTMNVTVLGTHFNVRCYEEDEEVKTTLEEGKVLTKLLSNQQEVYLSPGEAAVFKRGTDLLTVEEVNMENDIAWIYNRLYFNNESFKSIIKKIERSYGVALVCEDETLLNKSFFGDFDIETESVDDVLDAFSISGYFNYARNKKGEIKIVVNK